MIYMFLSNNPSSGDTNSLNLPCSLYILRGLRLTFSKKIVFIMANSVDPDEMQHYKGLDSINLAHSVKQNVKL